MVSSKTQSVSNNNKFPDFDTNAELSYIPSGDYILETDTTKLKAEFEIDGGTMDEPVFGSDIIVDIIPGDVNSDGEFNIADIVSLQNFLLGNEKALAALQAADFCGDGVIDAFDMALMRRALIEK